jgi:predicted phosphodiesterase
MSRVLVIGDIHEPVGHPGYLAFMRHLRDKWKTDTVVFIGDVVDFHGVSFHAKNPECPGPRDEYLQARNGVQKWYDAFDKAWVMIGNHDERVHRLAATVGIPSAFIRPYEEVWGTPHWCWQFDLKLEGVHYLHGTGCSGVRPAMLRAQQSCISTVIGHVHSVAGVQWQCGPEHRLFGMDVGCGVDREAMAMAYGRDTARKPVLSAGVVIDGIPYHEVMPCGPGEKFNRRKFKKGK